MLLYVIVLVGTQLIFYLEVINATGMNVLCCSDKRVSVAGLVMNEIISQ